MSLQRVLRGGHTDTCSDFVQLVGPDTESRKYKLVKHNKTQQEIVITATQSEEMQVELSHFTSSFESMRIQVLVGRSNRLQTPPD